MRETKSGTDDVPPHSFDLSISDHRSAEQMLRLQATIVRIMAEGVCLVRVKDAMIVYANPKFESMFGYGPGELIGLPIHVLNAANDGTPETVSRDMIDALNNDDEWSGVVQGVKKDGTHFWTFANAATSEHSEQGKVWVSVQTDITEHRCAEEALRETNRRLETALEELKSTHHQIIQQERLRALGQMASGVAHDFNNVLSPILGYADLLQRDSTLPETARKLLRLICTSARDAAHMVERIQHFCRPQDASDRFDPVDLGDIVRQVPELTRPKWKDEAQRTGRDINVHVDITTVTPARGNASELRELLTNLVFNAVDAMPCGGKITLNLRTEPPFSLIEVVDTGTGMTDEVRMRCVDPFFTTKGTVGTGMGLSVCHGIVQRHGGHIQINSTPGGGTTIRVYLPISQERAFVPVANPVADLPHFRVLLIDDDPNVRMVVATMLRALGQQVEMAETGTSGIAMFQTGTYHLVITDLGMPALHGGELTRAVKQLRPGIPVIMLTGWRNSFIAEGRGDGHDPDFIVGKPPDVIKLRDILQTVRQRISSETWSKQSPITP